MDGCAEPLVQQMLERIKSEMVREKQKQEAKKEEEKKVCFCS